MRRNPNQGEEYNFQPKKFAIESTSIHLGLRASAALPEHGGRRPVAGGPRGVRAGQGVPDEVVQGLPRRVQGPTRTQGQC